MIDARSTMAVAAGAAVGATIRWAVIESFPEAGGWPWAVFVVNVVGSFVLGAILTVTHHRTDEATSSPIRLGVGTGICGALTTFSTFAVEIAAFLRDDRASLGATYLAVSLAVGIAGFVVGRSLVNTWAPS